MDTRLPFQMFKHGTGDVETTAKGCRDVQINNLAADMSACIEVVPVDV